MNALPSWDSAAEIDLAVRRLGPYLRYTPLVRSEELSRRTSSEVFLKCENQQETGSFKIRGALNKIVSACEKDRGIRSVVTASNGNHGLAVAYAAAKFGLEAVVFLPAKASAEREGRIRA